VVEHDVPSPALVLDTGGLLAVGAPQEVVKLCRVREAYLGDLELSVGD